MIQLFQLADFSSLILLKVFTSYVYLVINYITHKYKLNFTLANILRLLVSCFDFVILLILLLGYIFEWYAMASAFSIIGILFSVILCAGNWLLLVQKGDVQSVFIINVFCLIALLMVHFQFLFMGLVYKGPVAALVVFNLVYSSCWLILDSYPKTVTSLMERIGEKLSWVDPLLGDISHLDLALRNVCSFNLGLLNLTYIHTSLGGGVNIITLFLIGLGLFMNISIGLRLIKVSGSVKLYNGFMVQIIINGYNNVITIYDQFQNDKLPKASRYAWAIALIMGLHFTSPSYCMAASNDVPEIDYSLAGKQPYDLDGEASPTGESRELFRRAQAMGWSRLANTFSGRHLLLIKQQRVQRATFLLGILLWGLYPALR